MAFAFTCVFACGEEKKEETVAIEETTVALEVGEEKMLQATKSEGAELEWSSSDSKVATVVNGKVTAVGAGQAVITVKIKGTDIKDEVTVTVTKSAVVASKVEIAGPTKVEIGATAQYTATVTPEGAEGTVAWSVSDEAVATIDAAGKLTAKAVGDVKVIATIGAVKAEYAVSVTNVAPVEPTDIQLWINDAQVENGATIELTEFDVVQLVFRYLPADKPVLEGVDVASGNDYVVAVDGDALTITAVAAGQTYLVVSSIYADIEYSFNINVTEFHFVPESITVSGDAVVEVNEEGLVSAVVAPERASQEVTWSSSDENIAVVDPATGVVTGKAIGKVTITATSTEVNTVVGTYEVEVIAEVPFDGALIYVNPSYTNKGEKVTIDGKEFIVGKNAVDTLAKALKNVNEGGKIVVAAGEYADAFTISKNNVVIAGPNAGVNAAEAERAEEAALTGQITVAAGVVGAAIDGVKLSSGGVLLEDGVDGFALQYCVIGGLGQDGAVRGPAAPSEVKNIKMNYNYSESYTSYRFGHFRGVVNGLEMIGNNLTCKGSYDFLNISGEGAVLKGKVVIENNTYVNSAQSFLYIGHVGVLECTISGNTMVNIANTFIDLRNMSEDGAVKIDIVGNEFKDSVISWMPIRIRTADYDANDTIVVNVYDNIFSEAFAPDTDGVNYYIENPSFNSQVDPFKAIYVVGKNLFIENGQVVTDVNNKHFCDAAISFEAPYASLDEIPGGAPVLSLDKVIVAPSFANDKFELDGAAYEVGVNAFTSIADAIAAVNENGVVALLAGEYVVESTITVNKTISILGPNAGVAADARGEEAVINPIADNDAAKYTFDITASNVVISGLKFISDKSTGEQNRRAAKLTGEIENVTFTYNYLYNFNTLVEKGSSLTMKGTIEINNNIFDGHAQFLVWIAPENNVAEFKALNITDNYFLAPQDAYGQFAYGAVSMRHEGATCEVNILRNKFDFSNSKIQYYFMRVCSGKLTISENTFVALPENQLFGGVTTSDWTVKGNTYLDAAGNAVEAPVLGNGVEEYVPITEITVDPNGEVKTIAEALETIAEGGTITVKAGTYAEDLTIAKSVFLVGEEGVEITGLVTINASLVGAANIKFVNNVISNVAVEQVGFLACSFEKNGGTIDSTVQFYADAKDIVFEACDFNVNTNRGIRFETAINGLTVVDCNFVGGALLTDMIRFHAKFTGEILIDNCSFDTTAQSHIYGMTPSGAVKLTVSNSTFTKALQTVIDLRVYSGDLALANVEYNILNNEFVDNTANWGIIRFRAQGLAAGQITANVNYNKFKGTQLVDDPNHATLNVWYVQNAGNDVDYKYVYADFNYSDQGQPTELWFDGVGASWEGWFASEAELDGKDAITELFISEYCEGSSNNKYIEIYNGTGADINLADYQIWNYSNGAAEPSASYGMLQLEGVVAAGDVFVVSHSSAALQGILDNSDQNSSNAVQFNGDDAVALVKKNAEGGYDVIDLFGVIGEDPGKAWTIGSSQTVDNTIVRNADVKKPSATWNPAEWTVLGKDVVTDCGKHVVE